MIHIPGAEPPIPSEERIAACVIACNGIPTEALLNVWQMTIKYEEDGRFVIFKTGEDNA